MSEKLSSRQAIRDEQVMPSRVHVLVRRDMAETLGVTVFEHEADILAEIHGEENVTIVADPMEYNIMIADPVTLARGRAETEKAAKERRKVPAFIFIPIHPDHPVFIGEEMERLRNVYGMHHTKKEFFANVVYPNERDLLQACGGPYKAERSAA